MTFLRACYLKPSLNLGSHVKLSLATRTFKFAIGLLCLLLGDRVLVRVAWLTIRVPNLNFNLRSSGCQFVAKYYFWVPICCKALARLIVSGATLARLIVSGASIAQIINLHLLCLLLCTCYATCFARKPLTNTCLARNLLLNNK